MKNSTLADDMQYMHYLSPTESGRLHAKKLADKYPLHLPVGSVLRQDLGFLGHRPPGVVVEMPHKRPPKGELTFSQKIYNQLLSPLCVVIEHAHSGSKRLHMVQDKVRVRGLGARELTFLYGAKLFALSVPVAVSISVLFYVITAAVSLVGAFIRMKQA